MIKAKRSFCQNKKYTTVKIAGEFIAMVGRLLRSCIFNILVYALGFGCGYVFIATRTHYYATKNTHAQYILQLEEKMNDFLTLDDMYTIKQNEIRNIIKHMKIQMSHDIHPECETPLGKILIKNK